MTGPVVGDDLFVTNPERLARSIKEGAANALLVKGEQIRFGETPGRNRAAQRHECRCMVSHRSGETEDVIADLCCNQRWPDQDRCSRPSALLVQPAAASKSWATQLFTLASPHSPLQGIAALESLRGCSTDE